MTEYPEVTRLQEQIAIQLYDHFAKGSQSWKGTDDQTRVAYRYRARCILKLIGYVVADNQTFSDSPSLPERVGRISSTEAFAWRKGRASLTKAGFKRVVPVEGK